MKHTYPEVWAIGTTPSFGTAPSVLVTDRGGALKCPSKLLGKDDHISELMSEFCAGLVWSIVFIEYLQVQNVVISPAIGTLVTFFTNTAFNFGFIAAFGFQRAPMATTFFQTIQFIFMSILVVYLQCTKHFTHCSPFHHAVQRGAPMATSFSRLLQFIFMSALVVSFQRSKGTQRSGLLALLFSDADQEVDGLAEGQGEHHHNFASHATNLKNDSQDDKRSGQGTGGAVGGEPQSSDTNGMRRGSVLAAIRHFGRNIAQGSQPSLLWGYLKLGIPGGVMTSCEQVSFDITTGMAGQLQPAVVAAHSAFLNIIGLTFVSPLICSLFLLSRPHIIVLLFRPHVIVIIGLTFLPRGAPGAPKQPLKMFLLCASGHDPSQVSCPFAVGIAGSIRSGSARTMVSILTSLSKQNNYYFSVSTNMKVKISAVNLANTHTSYRPYVARLSAWLCVAVGGMFMAFFAAIILIARNYVGLAFTNDQAVISVMAAIAPLAALFQVSDGVVGTAQGMLQGFAMLCVSDGVMGTAQGVLRGCGKQTILMVYNFVGFWLCGVLLGALLCFQAGMGVMGLWWGIASGDTVTGILNVATLYWVKWPEESKKAQQTLAEAAEQNQTGDQDAQEETDALIPGGRQNPRSSGKKELFMVPV
ncbi:hypothetical protein DUNSADRAFT_10673 [Dunaliella salina]|uniref:Multidrug and toxic compound extrusion protein n=1 Tax=Dunaliella salina TaxID=3046 RepID=A0ABQ7GEU9_DUNSA|nr:hypothetical protein DUNSADRAFT_10673 [Dunaliella salina]|eukprot:KAF5833123.1 hypothetical protein DUNSADRAFT_10673 [Dunaliella salina]